MNKILFSGSSNTLGLGLELEFRPRYNNHEWLLENGINLPDLTNIRSTKDKVIWKKYRWSSLVCEGLGYEEFNIMDGKGYISRGGNAVETVWLLNEEEKLLNCLDDVKYVILEMGQVRWWNKNLHGENEKKYPNTITEILNFIENPKTSIDERIKAINWLSEVDVKVYFETAIKKLFELQSKYKDTKFLWLPWISIPSPLFGVNSDNFTVDNELENCMIDMGIKPSDEHQTIQEYITINKMRVGDTAMGFNGDYKYTYRDEHANSDGHKWIASRVINYIKRIETKI